MTVDDILELENHSDTFLTNLATELEAVGVCINNIDPLDARVLRRLSVAALARLST